MDSKEKKVLYEVNNEFITYNNDLPFWKK
jgi:hypothetical protein